MTALFGMATKYGEGVLAVKYRIKMRKVKCPVARCTTSNEASNGNGWR